MRSKYLFTLLAAISLLPFASQASVGTGTLIKSQNNASIYYLGQDQKRYAFPNEAVFKSWFNDFSSVQMVSDQTLASYPLVKNVTYRPGTRLIKITTDPKVYAVARGSILRWIQTEAVARALYGDTWAAQVDDVADALFANYQVGNPIASAADFNRVEERSNAVSIDTNQINSAPLPPASSPTPLPPATTTPTSTAPTPLSLTLQTSITPPRYGETFSLRTEASPTTDVLRTKIFLDSAELRTCEYYICSADILIPVNDPQLSHEVRAEVHGTNNRVTSSTLQILASTGGSLYTNLILRRQDVKPNGTREIIAQATSQFAAQHINIYLDGGLVRSCTDLQECRYTERETSPIGTVHRVFMVVTGRNGSSVRSETKTFSVVANDRPVVDIIPDKDALFVNERMDVTVSASDDDGIQGTRILLDGVVLKTCTLSTCRVSIGPWAEAKTLQITGQATDLTGVQASATSSPITVRLP